VELFVLAVARDLVMDDQTMARIDRALHVVSHLLAVRRVHQPRLALAPRHAAWPSRPITGGSARSKPSSPISSRSTNAAITRTGCSSGKSSSSDAGNKLLWPGASPFT
jgi:hypothetical protein